VDDTVFTRIGKDYGKTDSMSASNDKREGFWQEARDRMVDAVRTYGMIDEAVLEAMRKVPRHLFPPPEYRTESIYENQPFPIGQGQTISQPFIVAYMTSVLAPKPGDRILEIGCGCGYQSAVLLEMGAEIYAIERIPELADHAQGVLHELYPPERFHLQVGDRLTEWAREAPFDGILGACAAKEVPPILFEQLEQDAKMILPIGLDHQQLVLVTNKGGKPEIDPLLRVSFVPLIQ
jgi:protein-L-isoaspartate(D-aspartate) O-methyltransferase